VAGPRTAARKCNGRSSHDPAPESLLNWPGLAKGESAAFGGGYRRLPELVGAATDAVPQTLSQSLVVP
jgi:hypothetical protein